MSKNAHYAASVFLPNVQTYTHIGEIKMTDKLFTVAGYSTKDNKVKARFATDMTRVKTLIKTGHTEIQLYELSKPMTKVQALEFLQSKNIPGAAGVAIANELAKRNKRQVADLVKTGPATKAA